MNQACFQCDLKQVEKVASLVNLDKSQFNILKSTVQTYLDHCDMSKSNPAIMADVWAIITTIIQNPDPYAALKQRYNLKILEWVPDIKAVIGQDLKAILKVAIAANLIDFSAKDQLDDATVKAFLLNAPSMSLAIDDSGDLFKELRHAKQLLYLGDNCGEIVIDRYLIECLHRHFPFLKIIYGVRGYPIVNDVTIDDAKQVGMFQVAEVISNQDGSLGTVLPRTSELFCHCFNMSDVVIAKGQGNYEGLRGCDKKELYYLFMSKCELVSQWAGVPLNGIVCMKNRF